MYIVIFKRPDGSYYFKSRGPSYNLSHYVGWKNQYSHEIVLIISVSAIINRKKHPIRYIKRCIVRNLIKWLDNIYKKID